MERIGVIGASYRTTTVERLSRAALPAESRREALPALARLAGFDEMVYLATCNRVEIYFRAAEPARDEDLLFHLGRGLADLAEGVELPPEEELYILRGEEAVRHLFRVTAALDSMMVGEAQIAGQVKEAHELAHELELLGGVLDQAFHEAFHLGKRVRTETELTRRPVSLVTLVERRLAEHLAATSSPVLILGAGEMAAETLRLIRKGDGERRVLVANRTPRRAERLAARDPRAHALPLDSVLAAPPAVATVVAATSAGEILLGPDGAAAIVRQLPADETLLVVDLALPPNVDPEVGGLERVRYLGIEAMRAEAEENRRRRLAEIDRCEALVEHQIEILNRRLLDRALSPVARTLHESFSEIGERTLERALARELRALGGAEREAVERLTRYLVKRLVQVPLRGLKGAAAAHSTAVLEAFRRELEEVKR